MKKVLPNNSKTKRYLDKLPKIYLVACWAKYGVGEFIFSGKYCKDKITPLVWDYEDCNGTCDEWRLRPIDKVTIGSTICWVRDLHRGIAIADALNRAGGFV